VQNPGLCLLNPARQLRNSETLRGNGPSGFQGDGSIGLDGYDLIEFRRKRKLQLEGITLPKLISGGTVFQRRLVRRPCRSNLGTAGGSFEEMMLCAGRAPGSAKQIAKKNAENLIASPPAVHGDRITGDNPAQSDWCRSAL
jgi:hypothetical protein